MNTETQVLEMLTQRGENVVWSTDAALRVTMVRGESSLLKQLGAALQSHRRALLGESCTVEVSVADRKFEVRVEPLRDDDGSIIGCIGMAHEVNAFRGAVRTALSR